METLTRLRAGKAGRIQINRYGESPSPMFDRAYRRLLRESEMAVWQSWPEALRKRSHNARRVGNGDRAASRKATDHPSPNGSWVLWLLAAHAALWLLIGTEGGRELHAQWVQLIGLMRDLLA